MQVACRRQKYLYEWRLGRADGATAVGVLNNSAYVICLALATEISAGGVGLVYLSSIVPAIVVKATVPLWYHAVPAPARMAAVGGLMALAYCLIAFGSTLGAQLAGVAVVSLQGGLGEATALALCARYPPTGAALTAWSSGTGFAGVFGYLWVAALRVWLRLPFALTLLLANGLAAAWLAAYFLGLRRLAGGGGAGARASGPGGARDVPACGVAERAAPPGEPCAGAGAAGVEAGETAGLLADPWTADGNGGGGGGGAGGGAGFAAAGARAGVLGAHGSQAGAAHSLSSEPQLAAPLPGSPCALSIESPGAGAPATERPAKGASGGGGGRSWGSRASGGGSGGVGGGGGGACARFREVLSMWPYTVPLFVVYAAEYTMQSGAWAAMGFPVQSDEARRAFYLYSNWTYQAAVFISRSSGTLLRVGRRGLWAMPALQCLLLAWFVADAALHLWDSWGVLVLCFTAGLLGGATYVNAFTLLSRELPPHRREFGLAAASVADSLGIAAADAGAVFLQGCLLRANGLAAVAVYKCGA